MEKLIKLYDEYIALLGEEINELVPLAAIHGWTSSRIKQGKLMRIKIKASRKQLITKKIWKK